MAAHRLPSASKSSPRFLEHVTHRNEGLDYGAGHYYGIKQQETFFDAYRTLCRSQALGIEKLPGRPRIEQDCAFAEAVADPFGRVSRDMNDATNQMSNLHLPPVTSSPEKEDEAGSPTRTPLSARSTFLQAVVNQDLLPRASIVLRKCRSTEVNLSRSGLCEELVDAFASCVGRLPHVLHLNLAFNALVDMKLANIVKALDAKQLISLNISGNKIDTQSASALASLFTTTTSMQLNTLECQQADMSDHVCATFLEPLIHNRATNICYLNLSRNKIGARWSHAARDATKASPASIEHAKAGKCEFTATEALAEWIASDHCSCIKLDLSWNMLRTAAARDLGKALKANRSLTHLNLEFNSIGDEGGMAIGEILFSNKTLEHLNVANNAIGPKAAFVFSVTFVKLKYCSVSDFIINGNPIGRRGGEALLRVLMRYDNKMSISMKECNFTNDHKINWFDTLHPAREYSLNLEDPYEYAVAMDLLMASPTVPCVSLASCTLFQNQRDSIAVKCMNQLQEPEPLHDDDDQSVLKLNATLKSITYDKARPHFHRKDADDIPYLYGHEMPHMLLSLGLAVKKTKPMKNDEGVDYSSSTDDDGGDHCSIHNEGNADDYPLECIATDLIPLLMHRTEVLESGRIELQEFMAIIGALRAAAGETIRHAGYHAIFTNSFGSSTVLLTDVLPRSGTLHLTLSSCVRTAVGDILGGVAGVKSYATSFAAVDQILRIARQATDTLLLLDMALNHLVLSYSTSVRIYSMLKGALSDSVSVIARLLPHFASTLHVQAFLYAMLPRSCDRARLRRLLGHRFQVLIGMATGHYALKLSTDEAADTLNQLFYVNDTQKLERTERRDVKQLPLPDTSQNGDLSSFRNETLDCESFEINAQARTTILASIGETQRVQSKLLEFDFVFTKRPPPSAEPMSDLQYRMLKKHLNVESKVDVDYIDSCLKTEGETQKKTKIELKKKLHSAINAVRIAQSNQSTLNRDPFKHFNQRCTELKCRVRNVRRRSFSDKKFCERRPSFAFSCERRGSLAVQPLRRLNFSHVVDTALDHKEKTSERSRRLLQQTTTHLHAASRRPGTFVESKGITVESGDSHQAQPHIRMRNMTLLSLESDQQVQRWLPNTDRLIAANDKDTSAFEIKASIWDALNNVVKTKPTSVNDISPLKPRDRDTKRQISGTAAHTGIQSAANTAARTDEEGTTLPEAASEMQEADTRDPGFQSPLHMYRLAKKKEKLKAIARIIVKSAKTVTAAARAAHVIDWLNEFQLLASMRWFSSAQACALLDNWYKYEEDSLKRVKRREKLDARVEFICIVHSRILDLYNFDTVLNMVEPCAKALVLFRLGILNVLSPLKIEGPYNLNLSIHEDRVMVKLLLHLQAAERAVWKNPILKWKIDSNPVPAWELPTTWLKGNGLPRAGHLSFTYTSANVHWKNRMLLSCIVLAGRPALLRSDDGKCEYHAPPFDRILENLASSLDACDIKWNYDCSGIALSPNK